MDEFFEVPNKALDLWQLVQDGVTWLEERLNRNGEIQFIGTEHDDHTKIPHIHAILLIERRGRDKILTVPDINAFREKIRQMALERSQAQERVEAQERHHPAQARALKKPQVTSPVKERPIRAIRSRTKRRLCWACGYGDMSGLPEGLTRCPSCDAPLQKQKQQSFEMEAGL